MSEQKFQTGYPRLVVMPPGILVLAYDEEDYNNLMRGKTTGNIVVAIGLVALLITAVILAVSI